MIGVAGNPTTTVASPRLMHSRLNALHTSMTNNSLCQVSKYDHITSTLRDDLHWLPIRQRIMYKLSTIVYKCIHGAAPSYLTLILSLLTQVVVIFAQQHTETY